MANKQGHIGPHEDFQENLKVCLSSEGIDKDTLVVDDVHAHISIGYPPPAHPLEIVKGELVIQEVFDDYQSRPRS